MSPKNQEMATVPHEIKAEEYILLDSFSLALSKEKSDDEGSFSLSFWIYLLYNSQPGVVIRQGRPDAANALPFLTIDPHGRLSLFPLPPPLGSSQNLRLGPDDFFFVHSESVSCPIERWINIICEVGPTRAVLYLDSQVVAQGSFTFPKETGIGADAGTVLLSGGEGTSSTGGVQGFISCFKLLTGLPPFTFQLAENAPLRLVTGEFSNVNSNIAELSDDGSLLVMAGEPFQHSQFSLEVKLMDALGNDVHRDCEIGALLVFHPSGYPLPKLDSPHPPLLVRNSQGTFTPASESPLKLVNGRSTFQIIITALSAQFENQLFCVATRVLQCPPYPFLMGVSPPIRAVSPSAFQNKTPAPAPPLPAAHRPPAGTLVARVEDSQLWNNSGLRPSAMMVEYSRSSQGIPDGVVMKYCLESMCCRSEFLKAIVGCKEMADIASFAVKVAKASGCLHNGYQIMIAPEMLRQGDEIWGRISGGDLRVPWPDLFLALSDRFHSISGVSKRKLSREDEPFLRRICDGLSRKVDEAAGDQNLMSREQFDRLWQWLYPVGLTVGSQQIRDAWESQDPIWIHGTVTKEDAEKLLRTADGELEASGTFVLRFANWRSWPHPDSGALVVSYVGLDSTIHHKLLSVSEGERQDEVREPFWVSLQRQKELSNVARKKIGG